MTVCRKMRTTGLIVLASLLVATSAIAQGISLSPAQQQMLNSLPPAQRQQAMDAIRQLEQQQSDAGLSSINEPLPQEEEGGDADIDEVITSFEKVAEPRSRLVIDFTPFPELSAVEQLQVAEDPILQALIGSHVYQLDESGMLLLPGLDQIPLLGLSEADINRRLGAEPYLDLVEIDARILGQVPVGVEALQPFGYDLFSERESDFQAPNSGPVPPDYVLGPGDTVQVQLFGNVNGTYEYEVSRDGVLNLPEIGPVTVAGIPFSEFRKGLHERVKEMLIGTQVSVTMGPLRTIRVFVLGDVKQPGSYVVGGLATISGALYQSGGVSPIGSLRNIQLKRNGNVVATLDVYDLLLRGDTSNDARLQPGDVIFVPPIGKTVSVAGAVNRPAVYEVRRLTTAADMVSLAGGLTPVAYAAGATLERIGADGERGVVAVRLDHESANQVQLQSGDMLFVPEVLPEIGNAVVLTGHVHRPGTFPWFAGMRLSDLIRSSDELKSGVDMDYALIRRENKRGEPVTAISASIADALAAPGSGNDIQLRPRDQVNVFSLAFGRQRVVEPLLAELALQATLDEPLQTVEVSGNVRAPGVYPLEPGMRVSDLIRAGGRLAEEAYGLEAELSRYSVSATGGRESSTQKVDLDAIRRGDAGADLELHEHDYLMVSRIPEWDTIWTVELEGEVKFPGRYRVQRGETLADVLQRAGGLTPSAFPEGAIFLRESLKEREQQEIEALIKRMEADLGTLSLQAAESGGSDTLAAGKSLLAQLRDTKAVGRLVIDLTPGQSMASTIEMRDGDTLLVPTQTQVVTVLGEVQKNTSLMYQADLSRDDYIDLSGGLTRRADKKRIYVVRANGAVEVGSRSKWFGRNNGAHIRPGDTIVVPLDTDRMRPLAFWGSVTQILYQGAIAIAAIETFSN